VSGLPHINYRSKFEFLGVYCNGRRILGAFSGYLGLAPRDAQVRDILCILLGSTTPLILQPQGVRFSIVGDRFVCDVIEGEVISGLDVNLYASKTLITPVEDLCIR
jgi:hypothetical protein